MQLVKHNVPQRGRFEFIIRPGKIAGAEDLRGAMNAGRLIARGGVGIRTGTVKFEPVERAGTNALDVCFIHPVRLVFHGDDSLGAIAFEN